MKELLHILLLGLIGAAAAFVIGMSVLFISSFALVKLGEKTQADEKADCIIVPGARIGGRALDFRLNMAASLYDGEYAPYIIVSGAQGEDEPTTEARYMAAFLADNGVPEDRILLEEAAVSTYENFLFSKAIMDREGFKDAIIVTNDYHCYRCGKMAEMVGISFQIQPVQKPKGIYLKGQFREMLAVMWYYFLGRF